MNKGTKLFALAALAISGLTISCDNAGMDKSSASIVNQESINLNSNRGAKAAMVAMDRFSLDNIQSVDVAEMAKLEMKKMAEASDAEDAATVSNLYQNMMTAEKTKDLLDINFSMSEETVEAGVFIFSLEAKEATKLTLEMIYDEEGYAVAANNEFDVTAGNNYKALNVRSMDEGSYIFRLTDDEGKELVRTVNIEHKD